MTFAELLLLAAAGYGLYRLLRPLRERIERFILRRLAPGRRPVIDVEVVKTKRKE